MPFASDPINFWIKLVTRFRPSLATAAASDDRRRASGPPAPGLSFHRSCGGRNQAGPARVSADGRMPPAPSRAAVHAAHLFGAGFFVVLSFDSRLESIIEIRGWGSPESPKRLMTPAVQQQPAGVSSFICQAVRFSGFFRTDSQPASMVLIRRMVREARRARPCTIDERPLN
jgi:hypothetical protein